MVEVNEFLQGTNAQSERLQKIVKSIDLFRFPLPITLRYHRRPGEKHGMVFIEATVQDRNDTWNQIKITSGLSFDLHHLDVETDDYIHQRIYLAVQAMVLHELDECYLVKGIRVRDPHRVA